MLSISPGQPITIKNVDDAKDSVPAEKRHSSYVKQIAAAIRAYMKAMKSLLNGKFAAAKESVPTYLSNPGNIVVCCCDDGIVIRFEARRDKAKARFFVVGVGASLTDIVPQISELVVYCPKETDPPINPDTLQTPQINFLKTNAEGQSTPIGSIKFAVIAPIVKSAEPQSPPGKKPNCTVNVLRACYVLTSGAILPNAGSNDSGTRFISRTRMELPVGWECIEVYPFIKSPNGSLRLPPFGLNTICWLHYLESRRRPVKLRPLIREQRHGNSIWTYLTHTRHCLTATQGGKKSYINT